MKVFRVGEKRFWWPLLCCACKQDSENTIEAVFEEKRTKDTDQDDQECGNSFDIVVVEVFRNQDERSETSTVYEMALKQVRGGQEQAQPAPATSEAKEVHLPPASSPPSTLLAEEERSKSSIPAPGSGLKAPSIISTGASSDDISARSERNLESIDETLEELTEESTILSTTTAKSTSTGSGGSSSSLRLHNGERSIDQKAVPKARAQKKKLHFPTSYDTVTFDSADNTSKTIGEKGGSNCSGGMLYEINEAAKDMELIGQDFRRTTASVLSCGAGNEILASASIGTTSSLSFYYYD